MGVHHLIILNQPLPGYESVPCPSLRRHTTFSRHSITRSSSGCRIFSTLPATLTPLPLIPFSPAPHAQTLSPLTSASSFRCFPQLKCGTFPTLPVTLTLSSSLDHSEDKHTFGLALTCGQ